MTIPFENRGGAAVGFVADLDAVTAASVIYLRMWCNGPDTQACVSNDLAATLGVGRGRKAVQAFDELCRICARHGRRPLMRHAVTCKCVGADEACFGNFVAIAAEGDRDDAMLMATLLVRPDVAPLVVSLAAEFGLALMQMNLSAPREIAGHRDVPVAYH
ncbi:hypothetical protein [Yoonia sp. SS1-5]|uniref:Uncharacterized protein n=1 Tax=Yoonia rhodophyticola TaxID=3137370 RepID=A0AAN0MC16_9RHOB